MKRLKRWTLFSIVVVWLCLAQGTFSLRATSLIFAKSTTTTTTTTSTESPPSQDSVEASSGLPSTEANDTVTKPPLTGIPQIDYIWDPNLPRELNGYNLTDYPFFSTVPALDEIDFKCDGLHDGFYASIPHKCQVYHHCLYGTRYDFLCANFTAFDQKTFICQFVSEVDCVNSAKYFHRNDALYKATTTTPPPTTQAATTAAPLQPPGGARRPIGGGSLRRRRPYRRRRPEFEYYEDELEEYSDEYYDDPLPRNRGRKNRPKRPNRRPETDYEDYEEDYDPRFDRRGSYDNRRRPQEDRRRPVGGSGVDEDRRRPDDDRRRPESDRRRPDMRRKPEDDRRRPADDDRRRPAVDDDRRRPDEDRRRPTTDDDRRRPVADEDRRRPVADEDRRRPLDGRREGDKRRPSVIDDSAKDDRRYPADDDYDRKPAYNDRRKPGNRRPSDDRRSSNDETYERDRPPPRPIDDDDRRYRPSKNERNEPEEPKIQIKPISASSLYSKPRAPPIIRRPVPVHERDKFDYTSTAVPAKNTRYTATKSDEYYDDYEEPVRSEPKYKASSGRKSTDDPDKYAGVRPTPGQRYSSSKRRPFDDEDIVDDDIKPRGQTKRRNNSPTAPDTEDEIPARPAKKRPPPIDYYDDTPAPRRPTSGRDSEGVKSRAPPSKRRPPIDDEVFYEDEKIKPIEVTTSRFKKRITSTTPRPRPTTTATYALKSAELEEEYYDDNDYYDPEVKSHKPGSREVPTDGNVSDDYILTPAQNNEKEISTAAPLFPKREPYVKILKRPFLPSRGGNPLAARGLQPVGSRALEYTSTKKTPITSTSTAKPLEEDIPSAPEENARPSFRNRGRPGPGPTGSDVKNARYEYQSDTKSEDSSVPTRIQLKESYEDEDPALMKQEPSAPSNFRINLRANFNNRKNYGTSARPDIIDNKQNPIENISSRNLESTSVEPTVSQNLETSDYQSSQAEPENNYSPSQSRGQYRPTGSYQNSYRDQTDITTAKPLKQTQDLNKNPLDITENEYDVTLNDALNPTLPNIPSRNPPSGFILPREQDYTFASYQRPRFVGYEPLHPASSDFTYQIQEPTATRQHNIQPQQGLPYHSTSYNRQRHQYITAF